MGKSPRLVPRSTGGDPTQVGSFSRRPPQDSARTRRRHRGGVQHHLAVCDEPLRQMTAQAPGVLHRPAALTKLLSSAAADGPPRW